MGGCSGLLPCLLLHRKPDALGEQGIPLDFSPQTTGKGGRPSGQNHQLFPAGDRCVEGIFCEQRGGVHGDQHHGPLRTLRLMDGDGVGQLQLCLDLRQSILHIAGLRISDNQDILSNLRNYARLTIHHVQRIIISRVPDGIAQAELLPAYLDAMLRVWVEFLLECLIRNLKGTS